MTARITIYCDQASRYGTCTAQLFTDTSDEDEAYAAAERLGWDINGTPDHCPTHSGRGFVRPGAHVVQLHPEESR